MLRVASFALMWCLTVAGCTTTHSDYWASMSQEVGKKVVTK